MAVAGVFFIMNHSIGVSQRSLEITQARIQIDNQVELLRHINNVALVSSGRDSAVQANPSTVHGVSALTTWNNIKKYAFFESLVTPEFDQIKKIEDCTPTAAIDEWYRNGSAAEAFFIDPATGKLVLFRGLNAAPPATFARVVQQSVYGTVRPVSQMVWIYAVRGNALSNKDDRLKGGIGGSDKLVEYYDFHVRACWQSPLGGEVHNLGTIVRLYEPL